MAATFARILGTEKDRLNCPFYFRIGACRHGDRCSRHHLRPHFSLTIMIPHMYTPSSSLPAIPTSESAASSSYFDHMPDALEFEDFVEDVLEEMERRGGRVDELLVVQNMGDHMHGNTYIKFRTEEEAEAALKAIAGRHYRGQRLQPEYSPVTDFSEAVCGMFRAGFCERGDYCNFIHSRPLSKYLKRRLKEAGERKRVSAGRDRGRGGSPRRQGRDRERSSSPSVGGSGGEEEERESSVERRARIAAWNAERDKHEQGERQPG